MNDNFPFEVLIGDEIIKTLSNQELDVENGTLLSLVNDFEDGKWRYDNFIDAIFDNIAQTALSKSERDALIENPQKLLRKSAKNLRLLDNETLRNDSENNENKKKKDNSKGSEIAEVLLYGVMKHHYKALSVVPKIFYKQNPNDNAKGADSVHIVLENDETDFSLWFGEAKFYTDLERAISSAVDSVYDTLQGDKIKKENSIITNVGDLNECIQDKSLLEKIKSLLNGKESLDKLRPKIHIPILLLYECEITKKYNEMTQAYKNEIIDYHKKEAISYYKKQIKKLSSVPKYNETHFHLVIFPVPDKNKIVNRFTKLATVYREE